MNRNDFHILARTRLREARILLSADRPHGAYYLAGYAVEYGLKACIAKKVNRYDFPDKDLAIESFTHNIERLVKAAGLQVDLDAIKKANHAFDVNWTIVKDWSTIARYNANISTAEAQALYSAITSRTHGIMTWIRTKW